MKEAVKMSHEEMVAGAVILKNRAKLEKATGEIGERVFGKGMTGEEFAIQITALFSVICATINGMHEDHGSHESIKILCKGLYEAQRAYIEIRLKEMEEKEKIKKKKGI